MTHKTDMTDNLSCPDAGDFNAAQSQCFVCEKPMPGDQWFAQVKQGDWTIRLCCPRCARAFYSQRLPGLRRIGFLAALESLQWPRQQRGLLNEM
jgi:hypothetical protein